MNEDLILTDCDGVILDWEKHFEDWMTYKGYKKIEDYDVTAYGLHLHYGLPRPEIQALVKEFNESAAIGFVPAFRDAKEWLPRLKHTFDLSFHVITSLTTYPYSKELRRKNLIDQIGYDFSLECLEVGADKDDALKPWVGKAQYWIEDKLENAIVGHELGFKTFLMDHGHNTNAPDGIIRVQDWQDIYKWFRDNHY